MAPKGTETVELPRKRSGLRKKARREAKVCFLFPLPVFSLSSVGSWIARVDAPLALLTGSMFRSRAQSVEPASWQGIEWRPSVQRAVPWTLSRVGCERLRLRDRSWRKRMFVVDIRSYASTEIDMVVYAQVPFPWQGT